MCTLKNGNLISIRNESELSIRRKSSDLLWHLWTFIILENIASQFELSDEANLKFKASCFQVCEQ